MCRAIVASAIVTFARHMRCFMCCLMWGLLCVVENVFTHIGLLAYVCSRLRVYIVSVDICV